LARQIRDYQGPAPRAAAAPRTDAATHRDIAESLAASGFQIA
jgi:hypothetical protein